MNKMNLREFAEVLVAMMNQQGTVCFLNNDNPAKQLAVAMSKGDACAYAPVAPLWGSYEKGADLNQMAAAVSMAMKESLDKGSEMAKMNADRYAQQPTPSFKKHEAKETSDRFANMGRSHAEYSAEPSQGQPQAVRKEFFPDTEEGRRKAMKMLQDIMECTPDVMTEPSTPSSVSEYDIVVMPLTTANYIMLQRNLLYTAVTRAKKVFVLFGQKNAVARAVKNLTVVNRNTRLGARISEDAGFLLEKQNTKKHERKTA